jgi:hypothetical protein
MNMNLTKPLILFLLFSSMQSTLFAVEVFKVVAWKPIAEASGYQIQIKDKKGAIIIDKKIEKNYYPIQDLNVGDYVVRSAPLNIFKKPVVWSPWKEIELLISEIPRVDYYKDRPTVELKPIEPDATGAKISELEIDGENFLDVTEIEISQKNKKLPILNKDFKNPKRIDVKIDATNAPEGDYDLTIINPFQKPIKVAKFLKIDPPVQGPSTISAPTATKLEVEVPKDRPLHTYSYPEFMAYLAENKAKNCPNSSVPEPALAECFQTYVTLNSKSKDSKDIFAFYKLISENQLDRINGYNYFESRCKPVFRPARERMNQFLTKERGSLDPEEIDSLSSSVKKINSCTE